MNLERRAADRLSAGSSSAARLPPPSPAPGSSGRH